MRRVTLIDAMADSNLFAPWFRDPASWSAWRAFLSALFALPMTDEQLAKAKGIVARGVPRAKVYEEIMKEGKAPPPPEKMLLVSVGTRSIPTTNVTMTATDCKA